MRQNLRFLHFLIAMMINSSIFAYSPPVLTNQKSLGGSSPDFASRLISAPGGGYWLLGNSDSQNGCVTASHGSTDVWLTRLDAGGNIIRQQSFGGTSIDFGTSIEFKNNLLYIAGYSSSSNGDLTQNQGGFDAWFFCTDTLGNIQWQRSIGGTASDLIYTMIPTNDQGWLLGGGTYSNDGDISGNHGDQDFWLIKTDLNGNVMWQRMIGGSGLDVCYTLKEDFAGNYFAAGCTASSDGDLTYSHGNYDWLVTAFDNNGNLNWVKNFGGSGFESAQSMVFTNNNSILIGGYTNSSDGDISSHYSYTDGWYAELNYSGNIIQEKCIGGSGSDNIFQIVKTSDNGYLFCSGSTSSDLDVYNNNGQEDIWFYKTDNNYTPIWTESFGGSSNERPATVIEQSVDNITFAGYSFSNNHDVSGNHGGADIWFGQLQCVTPTISVTAQGSVFCAGSQAVVNSSAIDFSRINWINSGTIEAYASDSLTVSLPSTGNYQVTLTASTCAAEVSQTITLVASPCNLPSPAFTASSTTVCSNSSITFSDVTSGNNISRTWYFPGGNPATSIVANPVVTYSTGGQYSVGLVVTNANGSQSAMQLNYISVLDAPLQPVIGINGTTLSTGNYQNYIWTLNGSALLYSNSPSISAPADGFYSVIVSNGSCSSQSDSVYVVVNGIASMNQKHDLAIYPNPSHELIRLPSEITNGSRISITEISGRVISEMKISGEQSIDISALANGLYMLRAETENEKMLKGFFVKN